VQEVRRIAAECRERREAELKTWIQGNPTMVQLGRFLREEEPAPPSSQFTPGEILKQPGRRWYPVIDYSRCTNCMECLDFCLFGVYGVDKLDRLIVENQDNCKRGCPACSRVCPEHAIMFPDYKTPAIAGAPVGNISGLKIDLSKLFGGGDAIAIAAQERDRELVADGRQAVGMTVGIPKRQADKPAEPKDDLDKLMDALDELEI
jgi:Pyruvate/2-oxoacid:ferredoxin oxidoreductase delta subunit